MRVLICTHHTFDAVPDKKCWVHQQCMEEVSAVARTSRQLNDRRGSDRMSFVEALPANSTTSLQRDIAEGRA
jgi:hypothetical protein